MKQYSEFQPTGFDSKGLGLNDKQDWLVSPAARNRDSGCLERSNFEVLEKDYAKIDPEGLDHECHRFGHWANGWFEIIIVRPGSDVAKSAEEWEDFLSDGLVADEFHLSNLECEEAAEAWGRLSVADRLELLQDHGTPRYPSGPSDIVWIMQARRDYPPRDDNGSIQDRLLGH